MANIKILVVDDDENICELLRLYLEKDGYDVQIALDGEAALEKFRHYNPDLILLDIMMPKKDGMHVLQEIRKTSDVPVIMITAKAESFDKLQSFDFAPTTILSSPLTQRKCWPASRRSCAVRQMRPKKSCALSMTI